MKAQRLIAQILESSERARRNDKYLQLRVWHEQGLILTEQQRELFLSKQITAPESIRRTRQKLQENGDYRPLGLVHSARQKMGKNIRQQIAPKKAEPIELFDMFGPRST